MTQFHDTASIQYADDHCQILAVRSYRQIAGILAEHQGASISPAEVEQMCRAAERKIAQATRTDPVIDQWLATIQRPPMARFSAGLDDAAGHGWPEEYGCHE